MAEANVKEQVGDIVSSAKRRVGLEQPSAADDDGHVGVVRGAWRAFGTGDHDQFLDALHEDIAWEAPEGNHFPGSGSHSGRDAVKETFLTDIGRTYTDFGFKPESFLDADDADAVVVIGRFEGEGVEGANVSSEAVQVWEFKGNSVGRVRIFADSADFPEVVTERKEREWAEEDKKKEEEEKKEPEDGDDSESSEGKGESASSEAKGSDDIGSGESRSEDDENKDSDSSEEASGSS